MLLNCVATSNAKFHGSTRKNYALHADCLASIGWQGEHSKYVISGSGMRIGGTPRGTAAFRFVAVLPQSLSAEATYGLSVLRCMTGGWARCISAAVVATNPECIQTHCNCFSKAVEAAVGHTTNTLWMCIVRTQWTHGHLARMSRRVKSQYLHDMSSKAVRYGVCIAE